jgi:hypothetical protein
VRLHLPVFPGHPAPGAVLRPAQGLVPDDPLFAIYWNFKVFPALVESYQHYFYSRGVVDVEDCGARLARWYCISYCFMIIPCLNCFVMPLTIGLAIALLVRGQELRDRVIRTEAVRAR